MLIEPRHFFENPRQANRERAALAQLAFERHIAAQQAAQLAHDRQAQARAREAQTLGFKKLILPESNKKGLDKLLGIRVIGVKNLDEAMEAIF